MSSINWESSSSEDRKFSDKDIKAFSTSPTVPVPLENVYAKSQSAGHDSVDPTSEMGKVGVNRCKTCLIKADLLYHYSVWEELISMFKVSIWTFMCAICGIGYEGRVMVSQWFGILESVHWWSASIGIVAGAYSVFDITNESLHRILILIYVLLIYTVSIVAIWCNALLFGNIVNGVVGTCYIIAVHVLLSRHLYVRGFFFVLWFSVMLTTFFIFLLMLRYKLWTALLITNIPADRLLTTLIVHATKTRDRLSFLQVASIWYCSLFESYRFLSVVSVAKQESQWTNTLIRFCIVDFLCTVVLKSEILLYIRKKTWCIGFSETHRLQNRITRGCANVTAFCLPIWWLGFKSGRFLMGSKIAITDHIQLVLLMHFIPELGSELALLFTNMIYANCTDYNFKRVNYITTLENRFFIVAYGMIPGVFLMLLMLIIHNH